MFEYYGWIMLRESYCEEDEDESKREILVRNVQAKADSINYHNTEISVKAFNGSHILYVVGNNNHKGSIWKELEHLIEYIAIEGKGSYGLLHYFDDEDENGNNNNFQVKIIKKGKILDARDEFLSPYWSEVEDLSD